MVEDRISDGKRIAQLLSSELSGRATPPLDRLTVVDADSDADPTKGGTVAYGVAVDTAEGTGKERIATVVMYLESVSVRFAPEWEPSIPQHPDVSPGVEDGSTSLRVESGAAVKPAADAVVAAVSS
jgi:hypothetical protein